MRRQSSAGRAACVVALALVGGPVQAQYKVVGPDGKVTYTDRPAAPSVPPVRRESAAAPSSSTGADPALPLALRQPASRFPVALYTTKDCAPCDHGRALLRERGIPYREWQATAETDRAAWARVVGSDQVPTLRVGQQVLSGFNFESWNEYLTTAGYPTQSVLPASFPVPVPQPLQAATRQEPPPPAEPPRPAPPPAEPPPPAPGGFRF
ncbi:glutaredoxin family protein [Aquabacterium sp. J223]|uniref:glutaredoxin family protein n=1 Tax=Aquabacterium sp. J223 TaxID=2898431 RepID=UPI0021AE13DE|nr:glutaredoxin family protein [Aquabacterium sp. J223]UUX94015.1 glutaredoxin family protein [Aquabacterium sp. J223]